MAEPRHQTAHAHHAPGSGLCPCCRCGAPETLEAMRRIEADISRREMMSGAGAMMAMFAGFGLAAPDDAMARSAPERPILLTNVRLFDGRELRIRDDVDVLVDGNTVAGLPARGSGPDDAERIDCQDRTVIPGLIDAHWHATLAAVPEIELLTADVAYVHLLAAREAGATLRRGFTTVRDTGGPAFALKRAVDGGVVEGPRIFPSGAMISQTSGHGDFRFPNQLPSTPGALDYAQEVGVTALADGVPLVLMRVREQLMKGASQIKMMAGGGVSSLWDPIDSLQFLEEELTAGVRAAADWGTYVCVHVYVPGGMQRAIKAGVRCIEHGQLADEETVRMMAGEGVWWSLQPFLADEDANPKPTPEQRAQQGMIAEGTARAYELAQKHGVPTAFGTDVLMNPKGPATQGRQLAKLARFMDPLAALRTATGNAGELLAMAGPRTPYEGALGVIQQGALADLLVVDGDPAQDLSFLADPDQSLRLIMKDGRLVRRAL